MGLEGGGERAEDTVLETMWIERIPRSMLQHRKEVGIKKNRNMEKFWEDIDIQSIHPSNAADYNILKPRMRTRKRTYTWHKSICRYKTMNTRNKAVDYHDNKLCIY